METGPTKNVKPKFKPDFGKMTWSREETCWICMVCQTKAWSRHVVNKHNKKDCLNQPAKPSEMPPTETGPAGKKAKGGNDKMTWSEVEKCWVCTLCQKKAYSKKAKNKHTNLDCQNAMPQNPSWQLGWDRKTMSCRYCGQTGFKRRRNIRKHLQNKNCTKLPNWNQIFGRDPAWWQKEPSTGEMKTKRTPYEKLLNSLKATSSTAPGPSTLMSDDDDSGSDEESGSSEEEENSQQPPGGHPQSELSGSIGEGWPGSGSGGRGQPAHSPPVLPHSLPAGTAPLYPPSHPGQIRAPWTNRNPGQVGGPQPQAGQGVHISHMLPADQRTVPSARMPAVVRDPDPENRPLWSGDGSGRELAGQTRSKQLRLSRAVQHPQQQYDQYSDPHRHERFSPSSQWTRQQQNVELKDSHSWERPDWCVKEEDFRRKSHPERHDNQERLAHDVYPNGDRRGDCKRSSSLERRDLPDRYFSESMARPSTHGSFQDTDGWSHTKPDRFPAEGPVLHDRRVDSRTSSSLERREVHARHLSESMVHPATHGSRGHTNPYRFAADSPVLHDRRGGLGRGGGQDFEEKRVASDQHGHRATSHYDPYSRYEENDLRGRDIHESFPHDDLRHERRGHLSSDGNLGRNCSAMAERHEGQSISRRGRYSPPRESGHGDYASRGRSRSPVGRRETVYMPEGRPRYTEREPHDSYRPHGFERYPAPETYSRREHDQDSYQMAREYSGSGDRDVGLPGYQMHRKGGYSGRY